MSVSRAPEAVLYSFRRCPYAIRARMALHVAGIDVQVREVALRSKPRALLALSPKATVPVLHLPDGQVIEQSLDIMFWALRQHDPHGWLACQHDTAVRQWVLRNDDAFKPLLDRYKYASRHPELSQQAHRDNAMAVFVGPLGSLLARQLYVCGSHPGWGDVALFPFVRQFAMVEPAWFDVAAPPALRRWLGSWLDSSWFGAVMTKHAQWLESPLHEAS